MRSRPLRSHEGRTITKVAFLRGPGIGEINVEPLKHRRGPRTFFAHALNCWGRTAFRSTLIHETRFLAKASNRISYNMATCHIQTHHGATYPPEIGISASTKVALTTSRFHYLLNQQSPRPQSSEPSLPSGSRAKIAAQVYDPSRRIILQRFRPLGLPVTLRRKWPMARARKRPVR